MVSPCTGLKSVAVSVPEPPPKWSAPSPPVSLSLPAHIPERILLVGVGVVSEHPRRRRNLERHVFVGRVGVVGRRRSCVGGDGDRELLASVGEEAV
jgi:hypothetical protein